MVKEKLKHHVINLLEMKKKIAVLYVTQHIMVNASWRHFPGKIGENSRHST